jgi:Skp family chaperone for outer membrane proteins
MIGILAPVGAHLISRLIAVGVTFALYLASPGSLAAQRPASAGALTPRVAFVDARVLLDSVPGRQAAEAGLADEVRLAETRLRLAADSLQRIVERFAREQAELSPMQREAATLSLRARELQLEDMAQQLNLSMAARRNALQGPLTACVQRAMREVQQRDGWHVIADREALGTLFVLHPDADVTPQVLTALRRRGTEPCGSL